MVSKNEEKKLPQLLKWVDILSTVPALLFTLSAYYFAKFLYINFDTIKSFSEFTSSQYQELAFSLYLFLCGCVVIPLGVAVYRVANDRVTFFSEQLIKNDVEKRYKPFVVVGVTILLTSLVLFALICTNEKKHAVSIAFIAVLTTANLASFLGIEWYRRKLAE